MGEAGKWCLFAVRPASAGSATRKLRPAPKSFLKERRCCVPRALPVTLPLRTHPVSLAPLLLPFSVLPVECRAGRE
ncbi:hypothetical protein MHYP_G00107320 [Metynnis hypsauchen]